MNRLWYGKVLTVCFVAVIWAEANAGESSSPDQIVGGKEVDINDAGWHVAIIHKKRLICSGSLLRKNIILTAAACVKDLESRDIVIRGGSQTFKSGGQARRVIQAIHHPEYIDNENAYNIGLIKLRRPFNRTVSYVKTIQIPTEKDPSELPSSISIYGWGVSKFNVNNYISKKLRVSKYKVYSDGKCSRYLAQSDKNQIENVFCIGDRTKQFDVCNDDIGGPAISREYRMQYGVISHNGACSSNRTTIITSLAPHVPWIKDVLTEWKNVKKSRIYI